MTIAESLVVRPETMQHLEAEYGARSRRSLAAHRRAASVLPGGETRAVAAWAPHPLSIVEAHGGLLIDADGHAYRDVVNNYTSLVHGNAAEPIADAVRGLVSGPYALASTTAAQVELAELLVERIAGVERVRFTNSGSEANALAIRIARRATGRRSAVVFQDSYHSSLPLLTASEADVEVVPYNDAEALSAALHDGVAAVFAEPFLGAGGVIPAEPGFLRQVQDLAHAAGALLVLDEVQALRNAPGGEQTVHGITPDLTTMGKIIGGGFPIGAVGGRAELLDLTAAGAPDRVAHAGTFNGSLFAVTAGRVALALLTPERIAALNGATEQLGTRIRSAAEAVGVPVQVTRSGSIAQVHLAPTARPLSRQGERDLLAQRALHLALLLEGVYATPRGMLNLSTALTDDDLDVIAGGYRNALARISA